MYTVLLDGNVLHDPRLEPEYILVSATLTEEDNAPAKFEFVMSYKHWGYNRIERMKSLIEVYKDSTLIFRGRPRDDSKDFDNSKTVVCESGLAYLYDSVVRPYAYNGTLSGYLTSMLASHNSQVDTNRKIQLGTVTVTDPDDYITHASTKYPNTFEELMEKCVKLLSGHFITRYSGSVTYLDYLVDSTAISLQTIELGSNLLDLWQENRSAELYTAIIPLGAKIEPEEGEESEADGRVTIKSVNSGKDYLYNQDAVDTYGWIFATQYWDNVYEPSSLKTKGTERLGELVSGWSSIEVTALDLSLMDKSIDDFRFFEYVQITSEPHGVDTKALIRQKTTDLLSPENSRIVVGKEKQGMTNFVSNAGKRIETIENNYVINEQMTNVIDEVHNVQSIIAQMPDEIVLSVKDTYVRRDEYNGLFATASETMIEQTATAINLKFKEAKEYTDEKQSVNQEQFDESSKYIRFVDGKIEIGKSDSPMTIQISNSRMSFRDNGPEVAHISNQTLWIKDADIDNSLAIGSLIFTNRSNNHLSLIKGA
jgi:hypothetical protein